jgi:hypothetical protein
MYSQIMLDKLPERVLNVLTLKEAQMVHANGKVQCDKEVGHYKRGWHSCKRTAIVRCMSQKVDGLYLDYCRQHAPAHIKATLPRT